MLKVHALTVSPFASNCYIVEEPDSGKCIVMDPGDEAPRILKKIEELGLEVAAIWNTHAHLDHIMANKDVKKATGAEITIHKIEAPWLESPELCGATLFGIPFEPSKADHTWQGGEEVEALGRKWKIRHTPGHSPGHCVFVCEEEDFMIGGDLLFEGSIGRTDLPGGDPKVMSETLRSLFEDWGEDDWKVYPGHGGETTLAAERRNNMYVVHVLSGKDLP